MLRLRVRLDSDSFLFVSARKVILCRSVRAFSLLEAWKQHSGEQVGGTETTSTGASDLEKMTKASTALGFGNVACSDYESGWIRSHSDSFLLLCTPFW